MLYITCKLVCVCVHCYWHAETSFQFKMRNKIQANVSRYDKRFDINRLCDLIRCISQQGARGRIDGTGQRRPIYVVVKTYLHFRHGMWLTREPPSRFYFCFNLLNSISTSICWISCRLFIGEIVISRFIFSRFFISIFLLTFGFVPYPWICLLLKDDGPRNPTRRAQEHPYWRLTFTKISSVNWSCVLS